MDKSKWILIIDFKNRTKILEGKVYNVGGEDKLKYLKSLWEEGKII